MRNPTLKELPKKYFDFSTRRMCTTAYGTPLAHYLFECEIKKYNTYNSLKAHELTPTNKE